MIIKEIRVPDKNILWIIDKYKLNLEIKLNWEKYQKSNIELPPLDFGKCNDWYFDIENSKFIAFWDLRRVKSKLYMIDAINTRLSEYAQDI